MRDLKKKINFFSLHEHKTLLRSLNLKTVCEEARCPNIGECFSRKHATIIILSGKCTRRCGFCNVWVKERRPSYFSPEEELENLLIYVRKMSPDYLVLTSPTRDDLPDGGAEYFYKYAQRLKEVHPHLFLELLVPDFKGEYLHVKKVAESQADMLGHNIETVRRIYHNVRPFSSYERVLRVLNWIADIRGEVKSAVLLGLGETDEDLKKLFEDLHKAGVTHLVIGQYFRPSISNLEVKRYYTDEDFERVKNLALSSGIKYVYSGRYLRSSYFLKI